MIELRYAGHLGNNLFGYALARILAEELGHALACTVQPSGPAWRSVEDASGIVDKLPAHAAAFEDARQALPGTVIARPQLRYVPGEKLHWNGHGINLGHLLAVGRAHRIVLGGYFQRAALYHPYKARIARWYRLRPMDLPLAPGPRDVVVHVRRSLDVRLLDRTLDVAYYRDAVARLDPARVIVCGTGIDAPLRAALAPYAPIYVVLDAVRALALLTRASRIVMANSTFSWWGAYLSEAERVVFPVPVRGLWSPDRPEIDLRVPEARYEYAEDAPLEPFRPFRLAAGAAFEDLGEGAFRLRRACAPDARLEVPAPMAPFVRWAAASSRAFGFAELQEEGFAQAPALLRAALARMLAAGALEEVEAGEGEPALAALLLGGAPFGTS